MRFKLDIYIFFVNKNLFLLFIYNKANIALIYNKKIPENRQTNKPNSKKYTKQKIKYIYMYKNLIKLI